MELNYVLRLGLDDSLEFSKDLNELTVRLLFKDFKIFTRNKKINFLTEKNNNLRKFLIKCLSALSAGLPVVLESWNCWWKCKENIPRIVEAFMMTIVTI